MLHHVPVLSLPISPIIVLDSALLNRLFSYLLPPLSPDSPPGNFYTDNKVQLAVVVIVELLRQELEAYSLNAPLILDRSPDGKLLLCVVRVASIAAPSPCSTLPQPIHMPLYPHPSLRTPCVQLATHWMR